MRYLLIALFLFSIPCVGSSTVLQAPFVLDAVNDAQFIARVRITNTRPFSRSHAATAEACGMVYSATVVEGFKGKVKHFEFFSPVEADFLGTDREYLIFVYSRDVTAAQRGVGSLNLAVDDKTWERLTCLVSSPLFVPAPYQNMWAFDLEASRKFSGDWLAQPNRPDLIWCVNNASKGPQENLVQRAIVRNGRAETVTSWTSAKTLINKALTNGQTPDC